MIERNDREALDGSMQPSITVHSEYSEIDEALLAPSQEIDPADLEPQPFRMPSRRQIAFAAGLILLLLSLALLPPLLNVNRYRRQVAASISASLGRPVRIDSVVLNLLPMPSFILTGFVVSEDPAFGAEPVIRANSVRATLRLDSLWRRRVEFSTIALDEPSVNLVHLPDNRWNVESILLQASRVPAAPTAQQKATETPRFPYIEATGARLNLKVGLEKMPLSLTEARFALWLSAPNEWSVRLEGHPNRTDTASADTGSFRLQGTLGRAPTMEQVPLNLNASWTNAPLGALSWIVLGRDLGVRGDMTATASINGTVGANRLRTGLTLRDVRRADFVPARTLNADITCHATATEALHRLEDIRCEWPLPGTTEAQTTGLVVTGRLPELMRPRTVVLEGSWKNIPAGVLLDGLRILSPHVAPELTATGVFSGRAACCNAAPAADAAPSADAPPLQFTLAMTKFSLGEGKPFVAADLAGSGADGKVTMLQIPLDLGAPAPAHLALAATWSGYTLQLTGLAERKRLLSLAKAFPQFGDGLEAILPVADEKTPETLMPIDATASHSWFSAQTWTAATPPKPAQRRPLRRR